MFAHVPKSYRYIDLSHASKVQNSKPSQSWYLKVVQIQDHSLVTTVSTCLLTVFRCYKSNAHGSLLLVPLLVPHVLQY